MRKREVNSIKAKTTRYKSPEWPGDGRKHLYVPSRKTEKRICQKNSRKSFHEWSVGGGGQKLFGARAQTIQYALARSPLGAKTQKIGVFAARLRVFGNICFMAILLVLLPKGRRLISSRPVGTECKK